MGFLERSRSLRRKDSAIPLKKTELPQATRATGRGPSTPQAAAQDIRPRPSTSKSAHNVSKDQKDTARPRASTGSRVEQTQHREHQPPMPEMTADYQSFRFPTPTPTDSPRPSTSYGRNITLRGNGSATALALDESARPPQYKRAFTSPAHVPQASVHNGSIKLSTKDLPKLEATDVPSPKKPTLHKSRSSTWKSFFQRKQSRPPVPGFDPSEVKHAPPQRKATATTPVDLEVQALPTPFKSSGRTGTETRGMTRQIMRAEIDRALFAKTAAANASSPTAVSSTMQPLVRPELPRSATTNSLAPSERFFDADSRTSSVSDVSPKSANAAKGPRLEVSIPTVELDRYSVMFEKLLQPKSSILERRKTALQGLQLPGEASASGKLTSLDSPGRAQRRATSPNLLCLTPLSAEFLESSSQLATPVAMQRVSGVPQILRRSKTAPPGGMSPTRAQLGSNEQKPTERPLPKEQQPPGPVQQAAEDASATSTRHSPIWSETSLPATPDTSSETDTFMSLDANDDDDEEVEEEAEIVTYNTKSLMPTLREPNWDMVTPTAATSNSAAPPIPPKAPSRTSRETSQERIDSYPPRTSSCGSDAQQRSQRLQEGTHPHPLQMNQVHRPAQISIARQVSVRRSSVAQGNRVSRAVPVVVEPSPVFSKQPLRPRVVEVRNRKSTMIVMESTSALASKENLMAGPR